LGDLTFEVGARKSVRHTEVRVLSQDTHHVIMSPAALLWGAFVKEKISPELGHKNVHLNMPHSLEAAFSRALKLREGAGYGAPSSSSSASS